LKEEALDRTMWRAHFGRGFGPVVRQTTKWMTCWTIWCSNPRMGRRFISSPRHPDRFCGPPSLLFHNQWRLFPWGQNGRGVRLTNQFCLVLKLRKSGAMSPLLRYAFMACIATTLNLNTA
jgi:hypothetical protein